MTTRPDPRLVLAFARYSGVGALVAVLVSGLVLAGWAFDIPLFKSFVPGGVAMNPTAAVACLLAGAGLLLLGESAAPQARRLGRACGFGVASVGAIVLGRYLFGWDLGIDTFLFRESLAGNRMAPNSAVFFVLVGGALALLDVSARGTSSPAQSLALLALALCLLVLVGYTFGTHAFYGVASYIPMAFNAVVAFTALAFGVLLARTDRGVMALLASASTGGVLARRLTLAAVVVPWALGWLRLKGEQAGIFDMEFGVSLMVLSIITLFLALIWVTTRSLDRTDTHRLRVEEDLRRSAAEIRDLYDSAPCGYHSVDVEGTVVAMNQTELRWLGYGAGDVIGRVRFADVVSPPSRETYRAAFARVKEHGTASDVELELVRKDGTAFFVLLNSSSVRDANGRYVMSRTTLFDTTERKRAEGVIRVYADIVKNLPIGLLVFQVEGSNDSRTVRFRSANPVASNLLGVPLEDSAGKTITEVFPEVTESLVERYIGVVVSGRAEDLGELEYGDALVARKWWSLLAFPLPGSCMGLAFQDVTERKQAAQQVRRFNEELEERIRERTAELAETNRNLEHKNQENEMFVYSVSHDLRSPLVNLQGFSKELGLTCRELRSILANDAVPPGTRTRCLDLVDRDMAESIDFILTGVRRLSNIIDALLRLSRVGRVEYQNREVDVRAVVTRVVDSMRVTTDERGAVVAVKDLPPAWGDSDALEQVFANLVGNALNYLDSTRPGRVEVGWMGDAGEGTAAGGPAYYVKDNGLGIPEAHQHKIFQAFQRAHPGVAKGEGIGLTIVRRAVERHRGKVWVESTPGEGSTFFVALPPPDLPESRGGQGRLAREIPA